MNRNLYGIFLKYPEPGKVKTRLAKDVGNQKAAEIYQQIAEMILKNTLNGDQNYGRIVFYDPPERLRDFAQWLGQEKFIPQQGRDVGERMDNAIRELLAGGAEKAVLTGADIPALNSTVISEAFAALDHADIVLGPAKDGGYYLIGMKAPHSEIFQNIPWSSERVFEQTMNVINRLQLRPAIAPLLSDIDRAEDLTYFSKF